METRVIYCTGCDREVTVVLRDGHEAGGPEPELRGSACLEIGAGCMGTSCPICAVTEDEARAEGALADDAAAR
jgi:hypothetical protein